jgi:hypothetical protein
MSRSGYIHLGLPHKLYEHLVTAVFGDTTLEAIQDVCQQGVSRQEKDLFVDAITRMIQSRCGIKMGPCQLRKFAFGLYSLQDDADIVWHLEHSGSRGVALCLFLASWCLPNRKAKYHDSQCLRKLASLLECCRTYPESVEQAVVAICMAMLARNGLRRPQDLMGPAACSVAMDAPGLRQMIVDQLEYLIAQEVCDLSDARISWWDVTDDIGSTLELAENEEVLESLHCQYHPVASLVTLLEIAREIEGRHHSRESIWDDLQDVVPDYRSVVANIEWILSRRRSQ